MRTETISEDAQAVLTEGVDEGCCEIGAHERMTFMRQCSESVSPAEMALRPNTAANRDTQQLARSGPARVRSGASGPCFMPAGLPQKGQGAR
jgi:hypothetical protein